jgi:hypothetical protein
MITNLFEIRGWRDSVVTEWTYSDGFKKRRPLFHGVQKLVPDCYCVLRVCLSFAAKGQNEVQKPGRRRGASGLIGSKESKESK